MKTEKRIQTLIITCNMCLLVLLTCIQKSSSMMDPLGLISPFRFCLLIRYIIENFRVTFSQEVCVYMFSKICFFKSFFTPYLKNIEKWFQKIITSVFQTPLFREFKSIHVRVLDVRWPNTHCWNKLYVSIHYLFG